MMEYYKITKSVHLSNQVQNDINESCKALTQTWTQYGANYDSVHTKKDENIQGT